MFENYLKIALRNIRRNTTHSVLNISGMAIGMASAFLILLWVQNELSYDRFHKNADNLYRVLENNYSQGGDVIREALTPNPLAQALKEEYPEIIRSTRYEGRAFPIKKGEASIIQSGAFVDPDFLEMFTVEFIQGDRGSALSEPHNIVITKEMADKYFEGEDPVGKTLVSMYFAFTITGVIKSMPQNSHISFDFLIPFALYKEMGADLTSWANNVTYTYIELQEGASGKSIEGKIKGVLKNHLKDVNADIFLQNIKKTHLYSFGKYKADVSGLGDITIIRMMSLIAVFILLIACINFMNLSTAQSAGRTKEIGVRMAAGAKRGNIIFQFLGESLLLVFVAHVFAMILVELLLPVFNNLIRNYQSGDLLMMNFNAHIGRQVDVNYGSIGLYAGIITVILFCGVLAGSYPALYMSALNPSRILKGTAIKDRGNPKFRSILVIFQFSLSVLLIICTLIIGSQLRYMRNINLGFNKSNIGYFQFGMDMQREVLKRDLLSNPDIVSVSISDNLFSAVGTGDSGGFSWEGKQEGNPVVFSIFYADAHFASTFQIGLRQGRFFSPESTNDHAAVVINEKAAKSMGFRNPVGESISSGDGSKFTIIGVVNDFHYKSLRTKIDPLMIFLNTNGFNCFIKMKPDKIASTIDYVDKTFKTYNLPYPLVFKFFDDEYENLYWSEHRIGKIFSWFSFLAIVISCLGLIGLSSYMTERRTKEMGIRKVNGARAGEIFSLLSKEYFAWVCISILIAIPIAVFVMHIWLQNFAYKVHIDIWVFILAGVIAMGVTLLTVSYQSFRASRKNPVEALRYE